MNTKIEISYKTILFAIATLVVLWLLFQIRDILYLLFIAFLLMTALEPLVSLLERIKIPRFIGIIIIYAIIFGFFGVSLATSIPTLITQSNRMMQELPALMARVLPYWNTDFSMITQQLAPIGENVVRVTLSIFSNIVTTVTVLIFTFYFLLERRHIRDIFSDLVGETIAQQSITILRAVENRLGGWVRGELLLMLSIGVLVYIGLLILRVEFALPLAILAGVLEIVPNIGPIISAVPAILIGLATSPLLALCVVALYFIVQQFENNIIVPVIMKKSVGLSPLVTILALMIGGRFAGITGAVLGVPVLLVCHVIITKLLLDSHSKFSKPTTKNPLK